MEVLQVQNTADDGVWEVAPVLQVHIVSWEHWKELAFVCSQLFIRVLSDVRPSDGTNLVLGRKSASAVSNLNEY